MFFNLLHCYEFVFKNRYEIFLAQLNITAHTTKHTHTAGSYDTELIMLEHKLQRGTLKTKELVPVQLDFPLFWKSHCATCVPA